MSQKSKKRPSPARAKTQAPQSPAVAGLASGGGEPATVSPRTADDVEPYSDSSAMPVWLFIALIVLTYWGMLHLDRYGGGFNARVYAPYSSYRQLASLQPKSGPELLAAKGESIYALVCVACHQSSGLGSPGQYPPLVGSEWVTGSPGRLIRIPLHGLTGPIQVNNQTWTGLSMPGFGGSPPLDNDENLAAVLTYIRQAWGNKAPPVTPEQVAAVRAETSNRTAPWTAQELQQVPE